MDRDGEGGGDVLILGRLIPRRHSAERDWLQPSAPREGITATIVVACHWTLPTSCSITTHEVIPVRILRSTTRGRLYSEETLLQRLSQDPQDVTAARRQFIQPAHPVVREGPLARHRHVAAADQSCVRGGVVGGATWAVGDQGRTVAGKPGNTVGTSVAMASAKVMADRMGGGGDPHPGDNPTLSHAWDISRPPPGSLADS
jgi:hypothetical protein